MRQARQQKFEHGRHHALINLLRQRGFVGIHEITGVLKTSEATARRDLESLQQQGLIRRVRGGAVLEGNENFTPVNFEAPLEIRSGLASESKRAIAARAVEMCSDGETVIIDGGSTTLQMAEFLVPRNLKILTNSFAIAQILVASSHNSVILPGGMVYPGSGLILDPFNSNAFQDYRAEKLFMGVNGIGPGGVTNSDPQVIRMERNMLESAEKLIICADSSKFRQRGDLVLCPLERVGTIITDSGIPEEARVLLAEKQVELIIV